MKTSRATWIKWGICALLTAICLLIPSTDVYNTQVKGFLAITVFCLALSAFELVSDFTVGMLLPGLWVFFGVSDFATVMSAWVSPTMLLATGAFFMAACLEECGLLKRIAFWMMCKVKGSYFALLFVMMLAGIVLNILTFGYAYVIVPAIAVGLIASLGGRDASPDNKKIAAGLGAACMLGCATAHSYTYQAAAWGVINTMGAEFLGDNKIAPLAMMLHNWPMFFVSLLILFVAYLMFRPKNGLGDVSYFQEHLDAMGKVSRREKVNAIVLGILVLYVFSVQWTGLSLELGFALIPFLLYLPGVRGAKDETVRGVNFGMLFFVASCMAIGTVATSLGLDAVLSDVCMSLLHGNSNSMVVMAVVFGIVFILNFFMTPMAIWSLITIPLFTMVVQMGFNPVPFGYAINVCAEAIVLPYEYVPYLIIYGFGLMNMKDFFIFNVVRSVLVLAGVVFVMTGYWHLIGLL